MENQKIYDLEERTARFAERVRDLCLGLIKNSANSEYILQLIRSSGPVGANYIEANERTGDKDFIMKIKTSRREAKESGYWLRLLIIESEKPQIERSSLQQEAKELVMIFSAILKNRESNKV